MKYGKNLGLSLPDYSDALDVMELVKNFERIEGRAPNWTDFSNSGTVLETTGDFQIATTFPIGEENTIFAITLKMPRAYVEGDTITAGNVSYNLYQGTDPALSDAWKAGEVVTINFDKTSRRCWASAGGGAPRPLPPQVSNLQASAPEGETPSIVFTWTNPVDENFAGMVLIVKEGSAPNGITDGIQVYKGTGTTFTYTDGVQWEHTYYARGFAYNSQNKFQMDATGAIASATPSDVPDTVSGLNLLEQREKAVLSWANPANTSYSITKVVQKINSAPKNPQDGTEVYSGTGTTVTIDNLQDSITYYWAVFAISNSGKYNPPASVSYTPKLIPKGYTFLTCLTTNTEWTPPDDDVYRITCVGKSADGGVGSKRRYDLRQDSNGYFQGEEQAGNGGDGGGAGGLSRSVLYLEKTKAIHCTINSSISSFGSSLSATAGVGRQPGKGTGGNEFNTTGNIGGNGGKGGKHISVNSRITEQYPQRGTQGGGNGAMAGIVQADGLKDYTLAHEMSGGGGGGGTYSLPSDIAYDDPLYTTRIKRTLTNFKGGSGRTFREAGRSYEIVTYEQPGDNYPAFSALNPVWYGGGNGGGGDGSGSQHPPFPDGKSGSKGSPGGILIERGVWE